MKLIVVHGKPQHHRPSVVVRHVRLHGTSQPLLDAASATGGGAVDVAKEYSSTDSVFLNLRGDDKWHHTLYLYTL
eukprot:6175494-Pleurochrysis_carterae.AAC.1